MHQSALFAAALAVLARAAQPGAPAPVVAPLRDLNWGQLNFLHTTDTHGWLAGHLLEPQFSADWGDYVSFSRHLRRRADEKGVDLLLVDTGDRVEGNGLYDASSPKGLFEYDIYREQSVDIICIGNHELYQTYSVERERNTTVPNFEDQYVASNLDHVDPETGERVALAQRYKKFKTKNQGIDITAFGFLFDFTGNANNSFVQRVEDTVHEEWFLDAIREPTDVFVVIGHVGLRMLEFDVIFEAIRKQNRDTPILFFGGHAHVRDARKFDSRSIALASGRYFETIGWMSANGLRLGRATSDAGAELQLTRRYIDTNLLGMYHHSGTNASTFDTEQGKRVSKTIARARKALNLDHRLGCAPKTLWVNRAAYPSEDSIFSWIERDVFPDIVTRPERKDRARLAIMNTGGIRFDIFKGPFTIDSTYIVSPFASNFEYIPDVPYDVARKIITLLNSATKISAEEGYDARFLAIPQQTFPAQTASSQTRSDAEQTDLSGHEQLELRSLTTSRPVNDDYDGGDGDGDGSIPLTGGYTTRDDLGRDGDDTVHRPLRFHRVPNCIQSEIGFPADGRDPPVVDLVFVDFVRPWVLLALRFAGGTQGAADVRRYMDGTLTYKLSEWITENWTGPC